MATSKAKWRIAGDEVGGCNCAWGCPCQFNALPTTGRCEALIGYQIREGHYGDTRLDGVKFAQIISWPGAIHEGNGTQQWIIDEKATPEQRKALVAIQSGKEGGAYFEIFAAVSSKKLETVFAPVVVEGDRERRVAMVRIPGYGEMSITPIKNPVSGEEHRARIVLPNGFEYKEAEMGNSVWKVTAPKDLVTTNENRYAQLNAFDWSPV